MKKILKLCFKDNIFRSYDFSVDVTLKVSFIKYIFQQSLMSKTPSEKLTWAQEESAPASAFVFSS